MSGAANPQAEWSVVASMLSKPNVIGEVIGTQLAADDFTDPAAKVVYSATLDRYYASDRVDPLIVAELAKAELSIIWGGLHADGPIDVAGILQERIQGGGYTDNTLDHAEIIKRLSTTRQLANVASDALMACQDGKLTPSEIGDRLSSEALRITSGTARREELMSWMDLGRTYARRLRHLRALRAMGREGAVYTGLDFIDEWTRGIAPGELCFLAGDPGSGKALALDTPLPTPYGWTTMGDVQPGETLIGADGIPTKVQAVSPVQYDRTCYRVVFSDGSTLVADAEHLWVTQTRRDRVAGRSAVRTTAEIRETLYVTESGDATRLNHSVAVAQPMQFDWVDGLLVTPYVLGCWLGDGRTENGRLTCVEPDLITAIERDGYTVERRDGANWLIVGLGERLADLGILGEKRIPPEYLRASWHQRTDLLSGLVDTDGHTTADGSTEITLMDGPLADDVAELALSLGLKVTSRRSRATIDGRFAGWRRRILWRSDLQISRLTRKRPVLDLPARRTMWDRRYIRAVVPIPSVPVKCVRVDSHDSLFLAGRQMIPTHNSAVAWESIKGFGKRQLVKPSDERISTLLASMEMGDYPTGQRFAQGLTGIEGVRLREADISDREYTHILQEWKNLEHLPIRFNFASNFRLSQLRALIVEAIRQHNVGFVVIDHFRMLDPDKPIENGVKEDEVKVRFIKESIAKDLNVAVLCLAHTIKVGRGAEGGSRPRLSDLRGSGQISAAADMVGFLHRPWRVHGDEARRELDVRETDAELVWAKNRFGTESIAEFSFEPKTMTIGKRDTQWQP